MNGDTTSATSNEFSCSDTNMNNGSDGHICSNMMKTTMLTTADLTKTSLEPSSLLSSSTVTLTQQQSKDSGGGGGVGSGGGGDGKMVITNNAAKCDDEKMNGKDHHEMNNKFILPPSDLLQWKDMPQHLQFNPYVLTGYRPLQTIKGCVNSLFYMHNETINILTHGIPIVYILATVPTILPWERDFRFLSWCHLIGSVAPWCGSFVYHLFMNLECGENMYYKLLQLDMLGIWISQSFGALPMVTATVFCLGWKLKWLLILTYSVMCLWGLYKAMTASSPWERRLCFLLPFTMRAMLTFLRASKLGGGHPASLTHVFLQDAVSVFGGAIGAMHIPEKWFPGCYDLYLNSHNIMHVLVVVAVYSMHTATVYDFEWMSKTNCHNTTIPVEMMHHHQEL